MAVRRRDRPHRGQLRPEPSRSTPALGRPDSLRAGGCGLSRPTHAGHRVWPQCLTRLSPATCVHGHGHRPRMACPVRTRGDAVLIEGHPSPITCADVIAPAPAMPSASSFPPRSSVGCPYPTRVVANCTAATHPNPSRPMSMRDGWRAPRRRCMGGSGRVVGASLRAHGPPAAGSARVPALLSLLMLVRRSSLGQGSCRAPRGARRQPARRPTGRPRPVRRPA